jgi:hypothetical protein
MPDSPSPILPLHLDVLDPNFPSQCLALTDRMRLEMHDLVARMATEIVTSRILLAKIDCLLERR